MRTNPALRQLLSATLLACFTAATVTVLPAQDEPENKPLPTLNDLKTSAKPGETPIPSPYDAFLALEAIGGKDRPVDWGQVLNYGVAAIKPQDYKDNTAACLMLGVKISDGLIAVKAQDAEALSEVASSIEVLAKVINVEEAQLKKLETVREMAAKDDWLGVFLELGYLQEDILSSLKARKDTDQSALIMGAGWTQGANFASYAIEKNYSPEASGLLREPSLISQLIKDLQATKAAKENAVVQQMIKDMTTIHDIVNIAEDGTIEAEKVKEIRTTCSAIVKQIKEQKK